MTSDLYGKPLGGYPEYKLSLHQKRQATLLYHWTSAEYLKGLKALIDALIKGVDVSLTLAKLQGRDKILSNERWGVRDTAANWSTFVFPALEEFRTSTIWHIAQIDNERYGITGANDCGRMIGEHSSLWMTPEEEEQFRAQFEQVSMYAYKHDQAVSSWRQLRDSDMVEEWVDAAALFSRLPRFRVHTDVEANSGQLPPRTGVYVPQDDPHGTLQVAWRGDKYGALGDCKTFNEFGLQALSVIGRGALWADAAAMLAYAKRPEVDAVIRANPGYKFGVTEYNAGSMVSGESFTTRPCKWYFVERIEGEFDDDASTAAPQRAGSQPMRLRCEANHPCPREGWWFTPAKAGSRRHFKEGEVMPEFKSDWGSTIWQWDESQTE